MMNIEYLRKRLANQERLYDNTVKHATELLTNLERKNAGLQAIIDGPDQIRDPETLELCVERGEYLKLHMEHEELKAKYSALQAQAGDKL